MLPLVRTFFSYALVLLSPFSRTLERHCTLFFSSNSPSWPAYSKAINWKGYPDFGQYVRLRTISEKELDLDNRRLIIVGDIHGMTSSLDDVLKKISYHPSDLLVHLGDTIAKGPNSTSILQQFTDANVTGVRGNHEQKVIEWRGWIEWVESKKGGKEWLAAFERMKGRKHAPLKWPIPKGWKFMGAHYKLARSLTHAQYFYLKNLPLVMHLPSIHAHLVHAGILPFDPDLSPTSAEQPLSHVPKLSASRPTDEMRVAQERALLTDIIPNTDPWVLLNVRSVVKNRVSKKWKKGTPWSDLWNMIMNRCVGFHGNSMQIQGDEVNHINFKFPCMPISVVYGHAAGRGLDVKRWSYGLDTGCVYGRNLTAMVITNNKTLDGISMDGRKVPFGEYGSAQLITIPCSRE